MTTQLIENRLFKALSEPIRLRVMVLLTTGKLCVCDLTEVLKLPQSTISRHMTRLKTISLVNYERDGKWVFYSLADNKSEFIKYIHQILTSLQLTEPYKSDLLNLTHHLKNKKC